MKVKNKLTKETLDITYPEFRKKFQKEWILRRVSIVKLEVAKTKANDNDSVMSDLFLWSNNSRQTAFESYRKTQLNKYSWNFKDDNSIEFNFYFELQWNFNHFGMSNWYIERM